MSLPDTVSFPLLRSRSMVQEYGFEDDTSQADTQTCHSESGSAKASQFSELVISIPPEANSFCLSILWTLFDKGIVQTWYWEDGFLRLWADIEVFLSKSSIPDCCGNAWFLRLIEATQYDYNLYPIQLRESFEEGEATDFSFLG